MGDVHIEKHDGEGGNGGKSGGGGSGGGGGGGGGDGPPSGSDGVLDGCTANDNDVFKATTRAFAAALQGTDSKWMQKRIDDLEKENKSLRRDKRQRRRENARTAANKVNTDNENGDDGDNDDDDDVFETWSPAQDSYAEDFLIKCSKRLVLEQEAALFYRRRHYWFAVPALILGTVATGTAFSQWSNEALCQSASWVWLIIAFIMAASTVMNGLTDHVFNFKARASKHHETYKGISRLIRKLSQELSNPPEERKPYRRFMDSIISDYNHYADEAELIPAKVTQMVNRMLEEAEQKQYEYEVQRRKQRQERRRESHPSDGKQRKSRDPRTKHYPQGILAPNTAPSGSWFRQNGQSSSSTTPTRSKPLSRDQQQPESVIIDLGNDTRAHNVQFLSAVAPFDKEEYDEALAGSSNSSNSSSSRNREFYDRAHLPASAQIEIDMPTFEERYCEQRGALRRRSIVQLDALNPQFRSFASEQTEPQNQYQQRPQTQQRYTTTKRHPPAVPLVAMDQLLGRRGIYAEPCSPRYAREVEDHEHPQPQPQPPPPSKPPQVDDTPTPERVVDIARSGTDLSRKMAAANRKTTTNKPKAKRRIRRQSH